MSRLAHPSGIANEIVVLGIVGIRIIFQAVVHFCHGKRFTAISQQCVQA
jgi:hypothetical protein